MPPIDSDHDRESVTRRLDALERAVSEEEPIQRADRIDELESRVAELEAAVQALRGYVGSVRAVNEEIELRADRALRKAEAVERTVAPESVDAGDDPGTDADSNGDTDVNGDADRGSNPFAELRERL